MLMINFSLLSPGKGLVFGVAKVQLPFSVEFVFEDLNLDAEEYKYLRPLIAKNLVFAAKKVVLDSVFQHIGENYPGQVCFN